MTRLLRLIPMLLFVLMLGACNKGGSGGTPTPNPAPAEENLAVTLNPDPGTSLVRASSGTYSFQVNITSKIPSGGVDVLVEYKKDSDNSTLFSQTLQSTTTPVSVTVNNIPATETGTVSVTVKSRSKPSNTAARSFKLSRK